MVAHAQPDSAVFKAMNPAWPHDMGLEVLRQIERDLRVLAWQQTKDGARGANAPELLRFPWEPEPDNGAIKGDVMDMDEAAEWLGWDVPVSA